MRAHGKPLRVGDLIFTPGDPRVVVGDRLVILRGQELALLELLVSQGIVSTETIATRLARNRSPLSDTTVASYIHRLRARLAPLGLMVLSARRFGYTLQASSRSINPRRSGPATR